MKHYHHSIEVLFENDLCACVLKPAGMVTSGNQFKTLRNALVGQLSPSSHEDALDWAQPVHRLDAATSGVVLLAKTVSARQYLFAQFEARSIEKNYLAICSGFLEANGQVNTALATKEAITDWQVLQRVPSLKFGYVTYLRVQPKTGRTHQIRKHLSQIGHPILGDRLYGDKIRYPGKGLFLHASSISFALENRTHTVEAPTPQKFMRFLENEQKQWQKIT